MLTLTDNRPQMQEIHLDDLSVTPPNIRLDRDRSPSFSSSEGESDAETVIRWETPPSRVHTPPPRNDFTIHFAKKRTIETNVVYESEAPSVVRFDEEQIRSDAVEASKKDRMENFDLESQPPTPSNDDTPYIRFAIDQLTRDQEVAGPAQQSNATR